MKILNALIEALTTYLKQKATIAALNAQIVDLNRIIDDLRAAAVADDADDAALIAAAAAAKDAQNVAETELANINAANAESEAKAEELLAAIHADDTIPVQVKEGAPVLVNEAV